MAGRHNIHALFHDVFYRYFLLLKKKNFFCFLLLGVVKCGCAVLCAGEKEHKVKNKGVMQETFMLRVGGGGGRGR
jgi:hypothetical protein